MNVYVMMCKCIGERDAYKYINYKHHCSAVMLLQWNVENFILSHHRNSFYCSMCFASVHKRHYYKRVLDAQFSLGSVQLMIWGAMLCVRVLCWYLLYFLCSCFQSGDMALLVSPSAWLTVCNVLFVVGLADVEVPLSQLCGFSYVCRYLYHITQPV